MGYILERDGKEERERRNGMTSRSLRCRDVGATEGIGNSDRVPTRNARTDRRRSRIVLFANNTAPVTAIKKETPGSIQQTSQKSVDTAITFLDGQRSKYRWSQGIWA